MISRAEAQMLDRRFQARPHDITRIFGLAVLLGGPAWRRFSCLCLTRCRAVIHSLAARHAVVVEGILSDAAVLRAEDGDHVASASTNHDVLRATGNQILTVSFRPLVALCEVFPNYKFYMNVNEHSWIGVNTGK